MRADSNPNCRFRDSFDGSPDSLESGRTSCIQYVKPNRENHHHFSELLLWIFRLPQWNWREPEHLLQNRKLIRANPERFCRDRDLLQRELKWFHRDPGRICRSVIYLPAKTNNSPGKCTRNQCYAGKFTRDRLNRAWTKTLLLYHFADQPEEKYTTSPWFY